MNLILIGIVLALIGVAVGWFKWFMASREVERLLETTATLEEEKAALQQQKAVVETQVKHYQVKQKNEESTRHLERDAVIEQLYAEGDLRD
ncbi:DUF2681 domain-containing protein [Lonepinella sp. BR2474]|uniref:DUF2681 domain-containing protein n=1 Tax=unclassified Lonepinella TaxID=2642006 RepID=UPI003F6DDC2E